MQMLAETFEDIKRVTVNEEQTIEKGEKIVQPNQAFPMVKFLDGQHKDFVNLCAISVFEYTKRCYQKPQFEGQTIQWPTEKDKRTMIVRTLEMSNTKSLKTGGELRCSGRFSRSCSTSKTHRVTVNMHLSLIGLFVQLVCWYY